MAGWKNCPPLKASSPVFRLLTRYNSPPDDLGISEDSGLDGFMFGGGGHGYFSIVAVFTALFVFP